MSSANYEFNFSGKLTPETQRGMAQADDNAKVEWKRVVDGCVMNVAMEKQEFTVDDVLAKLESLPFPPKTHNDSALGPRMKEVSKTLKYMTATERVQRSRRPEKHGNLQRVWKSNIFRT